MTTIGEYEGLGMTMHNPLFAESFKNFPFFISNAYGPDITESFEEVQKRLLEFYLKDLDESDTAAVDKRLVEFIGDSLFNIGALATAKSCVKNGNNTYLASFDYFNTETEDPLTEKLPFKAATHGSDFKYITGEGLISKFTPTEEELKVMNMMGDFVTNFVKYGNPNGKSESGAQVWEKYNLDKPNRYFKIDYPKSEMRDNYQNGRMDVYEQINRQSNKYQEIVPSKNNFESDTICDDLCLPTSIVGCPVKSNTLPNDDGSVTCSDDVNRLQDHRMLPKASGRRGLCCRTAVRDRVEADYNPTCAAARSVVKIDTINNAVLIGKNCTSNFCPTDANCKKGNYFSFCCGKD
ncbi:unnamed protein product [Caenorhabditis sp. 36 PRJEB53466]|nr:unnamed protein product [Caenorhabditis sp. 36 PRJEB53466]